MLTKLRIFRETIPIFRKRSPQNPHVHLIETIGKDVLPNRVRIYESEKMSGVLDQDHVITLPGQKVELANTSLKPLSVEDQHTSRAKIDRA